MLDKVDKENGLATLRKMNNYTKTDISLFLGLCPQAIYNMERAKSISFRNALILSKLYNVSVEEIYLAVK
ncbi:TPA: helix-turn-helix transcriptional regulator [Clostridioides difficile]|nr:helix-turn-helix transcriptional regulator [Clostridioides difficile]